MTRTFARDEAGKLITYAWPGGYPVFYVTADAGILCPDCARMAEAERTREALIDLACTLGGMMCKPERSIVRVYPEYVEPAPVSYDWRTNLEA
jgi:hypothetical protein